LEFTIITNSDQQQIQKERYIYMRKQILFITTEGSNQIPVMVSLVQVFQKLALCDPAQIEYIHTFDLEPMMHNVRTNPEGYFIVVPAVGSSPKRRCVVCAPGMSHAFSGELQPAAGVMVHTNIPWEDCHLLTIASQLLHWIKEFNKPNLSGYPWGRHPTRTPAPHSRQKPCMSSHAYKPGGTPLKAERVFK
jgi:hypothetical protein